MNVIVSEKQGTIEKHIPDNVMHDRFNDYCANANFDHTGELYLFRSSHIIKEWDGTQIILHDEDE
jgi:hypothetical protein